MCNVKILFSVDIQLLAQCFFATQDVCGLFAFKEQSLFISTSPKDQPFKVMPKPRGYQMK